MEGRGNDILLKDQETYSLSHSEEVQEILGHRPAWILRWGITVIILILVGIILACYYVKYPQTVMASITLTSDNPPSDLGAKSTGILDSVYVADGEIIKKGQVLALIANSASLNDIVIVEELLVTGRLPQEMGIAELSSLHVGNLQDMWIEYLSICSDYYDYLRLDQIGRKKTLVAEQVRRSKEYYGRLEMQRELLAEDLMYELRALERDSIMLQGNYISQAEYESARKTYLSKKSDFTGFEASMTNALLSCLQKEQQILELETQKKAELLEFERRLAQSRNSLLGQLSLWKEEYAIVAPYDGAVSLQNVWSKGQRVIIGDIIASVIPSCEANIMGRLKVPSSGFGKVRNGQDVNIKLSGFPYLEFGIVKGKVSSMSSVPERTLEGLAYTVDVILPDGLESTYNKELPFVQDMDGIAEIITDDMRLIEHFLRPIQSLFVNR